MSKTSSTLIRSTAASGSIVYESSRAVQEYLLMHYGKPVDIFPYPSLIASTASAGLFDSTLSFPRQCSEISYQNFKKYSRNQPRRCLDLGCAVGGSSMALSKHFDNVIGVDYSQAFVDAANHMKTVGSSEIEILSHGDIRSKIVVKIDDDISIENRERISFTKGDACDLSPELGSFDLILGSNLLCRLPKPRKFLDDIQRFLNPQGVLVLISPYSWLEEYTEKEEWIGGRESGKDSFNELVSFMRESSDSNMKLVHQEDLAFLIREHQRKFQLGVSDCTVWLKDSSK